MSDREQFLKQIDKIVGSHSLHGSESLCRLLRYAAHHALDHPGQPLKEYQIATEVFGRPSDFDPQSDSTIRVQAGRLRTKLTDYYASEGAADGVVVELPKGTYVLSFRHRAVNGNQAGKPASSEPQHASAFAPAGGWRSAFLVAGAMLLLALATIATLVYERKPGGSALASESAPGSAAFRSFWYPFVSAPQDPWVVFSNAAFVGRPETGLRYFNNAQDSRDVIFDHYTGVGEVLAVHDLDEVFEQLGRRIKVKRGSLFSLDDVQNNDLIFLGSPSENLTLDDIPGSKEFVFSRLKSGPRAGDLAIVNVHPQAGEPQTVVASPASSPLTEDYAIIALMPGLNPSRSVMILAGTTTFGTEGAVEFVSRQNSVSELLSRLSANRPGELKPFEALLRVKVARGVPVETELLALRKTVP
ncbi:MAG TPA: helix-turn-helix domain-containing protein [Candidatus Binatia bacterium]|nr:helix-turn-helix domain-containing protein [Candidatus Binatia bacterium]